MLNVWLTLIFITLCAIVVLVAYFIHKNTEYKDKLLEISKYEINTRNTIEMNASDLLTRFIEDCFVDYQVMILIPRDELYINDDREQEITNDLVSKVAERFSPNMLDRLSTFYNPNSIDKVIADKISIVVSNYCIDHNRIILDSAKK
jgi:hypothetical protein